MCIRDSYLPMGTKSVSFTSDDAKKPAKFYFLSCPAHAAHPARMMKSAEAAPVNLGSQEAANQRTIYKFIHQGGIQSCQLVICLLYTSVAGLITCGSVRVIGCGQDRLVTAITTLLRMGAQVRIDEFGIAAFAPDGLHAAAVSTDVHPGFMTDWQTPLMVLFTQAEGMSVLHETCLLYTSATPCCT